MANSVKFGDFITIQGFIQEKGQNNPISTGLITTTGYTNGELYLEKLSKTLLDDEQKNSAGEAPIKKPEDNISAVKNYRDFVFQIWPKLDYDAHKKYSKLREEKQQIQKKLRSNKDNVGIKEEDQDSTKEYLNEIREKLKLAQTRMESEQQNNMKLLDNVIGNYTCYGQEIFLMHADSNSFLNGLVLASGSEKSAFMLQVTKYFQRGMVFKIMPKYKLRKEGEPIQYKDQIQILNVKQQCWASFIPSNVISQDKPIAGSVPTNYYKSIDFKKNLNRQRVEVFLTKLKDAYWQMHLHSEYAPPQDNQIRGGDLVYLYHTELQGSLSADIPYKNTSGHSEAFIRRYEGEYEQEKNCISSLWEIEVEANKARGQNVQVSTLHSQEKGTSQSYKLRHFLTGKVLSLSQFQQKGKNVLCPCLPKDDLQSLDQNSRVQFVSTSGDDKDVMENNLCYLVKINNQFMVGSQQVEFQLEKPEKKQQQNQDVTNFKDVTEEMIYKPIADSEFEITRQGLVCLEKGGTEENAFQIIKLTGQEKEDILFVNSSIGFLQKFLWKLRNVPQKEPQPKKEQIKKVIQILSDLVFFLVKTESKDPLNCEGIPNVDRQRIMKDFKFIELLVDLLYYPLKLEVYKISELDQIDPDIVKIFKLCNALINHTIKEYRPNEIYASQWIDLLIFQSIMTEGDCDIGSEETLTELIDNNKKILERIDEVTVKKFLKMLYDEQEDKYVKLVRALVLCNGQAVPNQELISKLLLSELDQNQDDEDENGEVSVNNINKVLSYKMDPSKPLIIQSVKFMKGEVYVQSPFKEDYGCYIKLIKFQEMAKEQTENQEKFNYFIEMIILLSNLCKDRNYIAIKDLVHVYKRRVCFEILNNPEFHPSLRNSFAMLVHSMYLDISEFKKFSLPNYIRVWTEIEKSRPIISVFDNYNEDDMARLSKENSFVSPILYVQTHLKTFSLNYLANIAKSKYMDSSKEEENHLTYSILQMIQQMIDFGFFDTSDELFNVLKLLIKVLNSTIDVSNLNEIEFADEIVKLFATSRAFKGNIPQMIKKIKGRTMNRFSTRYEETEDNLIVQQCKVLCCNIVKKIILIRDDMRLTDFMKKFKTEIEIASLTQLRLQGKQSSKKKSIFKPFEIETPKMGKKKALSQVPLLVEKPISIDQQGDKSPFIKNSNQEQDIFGSADEEARKKRVLTLNKTALQLINEQNLVKIRGCVKVDVVAVFQDLTLYQYPDLVNISFEILNLLFTEKQAILNLLKNVQLLEEDQQIQTFSDLKRIQDELTEQIEKSENWLFKTDETSLAEAVKVEMHLQQLVHMLATKSQNQLSSGDNQGNEPDGERLPTTKNQGGNSQNEENKQLYGQLFNEDEFRNQDTQELVRNSYIYNQVIDLLKYDASTLSRQRSEAELKQSDFQDNGIYIRILRLCYKMLGRLVYENPQNKTLLTEIMLDFILKHMKYLPQSSANFVLDPLIDQNPLIIQDEDVCRKVVREIIYCVNTIKPFQPGLAACYLDSLRRIPYLNDLIIKENQTLIIDYLTNKENSNLLSPILIKEAPFQNISKAIQEFQKNLESGHEDVITVPGEVDYFNSLIYLMAVICDQKNNATESKAQSYVPLQSLKELLSLFKNCYYVKKYLYFFFFHVYLDTEKEMSEELKAIKQHIISQIQEDFSNISSTLVSQGFSVMTYKGSVPIQKIKLDYIFNSLLLCVDTILFKKLIEPNQEKVFLVSLLESLVLVSRYPTLKAVEKKKIKGIFIQLIQRGFVTIANLREQIQTSDIVPNALEVRQVQKNLYEFQVIKTTTSSQEISSYTSYKSATLIDIVKKLTISEEFQESIRTDFKEFVDYFTNIKNISMQTFQGICTIDFSELTSSMIQFMVKNRSSDNNDSVSNELQKKRLQVLRQIIELEYPENNDPVDLWDSMGGYEEEIQKRQNKLVQQGVIEMIVEIIKDPFAPYDLKEESILLGIALLLGGNLKSQEEFLNQLTSDNNNQFLGTLHEIIQKGIQVIKKNMSKINKQNEYRMIEKKREVINPDQNDQGGDFDEKLSDDEVQAENIEEISEDEENTIPQNVLDEIKKVRRVYRILQLFCEGHNNNLQNHLRIQVINKQESGKSIDFILNTSILFSNMIKYMNSHCIELADQILDFLIEVIQGPCTQNQIVMCRGKVIETCKDILQKYSGTIETNKEFTILGFHTDKKGDIDSFVNKSFKLLYSLIEGEPSPDIVDLLCSVLDFQFLMQILVQRYDDLKLQHNIKDDNIQKLVEKIGSRFDDALTEVFDIFLLISTLSDRKESIKEILVNPTEEQAPAIQFFQFNTASIEVVFQNKLIRVYFPIQPICRLLSKGTRLQLMEEIPRNTPSEKIEGLVDASTYLFDEMEHLAFLKRQIFYFSSGRLQAIMLFSYFLALIINLTIMFTYELSFDGFQKGQTVLDDQITQVTSILGIIQFITTLFIIVFWIMINGPLILKRTWHQIIQENENPNKSDEEVRTVEAKYLSLSEAMNVLSTKGPDAPEFWKTGKRDFGHLFLSFIYYWKNFQFMMLQGSFIYLLFYVTVSAMGLFLSDIVYCLHLLDIIVRFPTLQNVIKAVTTNIGQLGLTTLLGAVIIYIYSIFAFYFSDISFNFGDIYDSTGASGTENVCTTLFQCYLYTLNKGLVSGGGIGEGVSRPSQQDDVNTYVFRYIFDLTFFMIINITFLNFIFGIIIDTFAQLRDEKQQKEEDKNNVCFICGLPRDDFDQVPGGFSIHIETYHQLWSYVHYIYHLRCKDSTEYNGIESEIQHMLSKKNTGWFPLLRALSINSEGNQDKEHQIEGKFLKLKNGLKEISSKVEKISTKQGSSGSSTK